jgi:hypothetical protein
VAMNPARTAATSAPTVAIRGAAADFPWVGNRILSGCSPRAAGYRLLSISTLFGRSLARTIDLDQDV